MRLFCIVILLIFLIPSMGFAANLCAQYPGAACGCSQPQITTPGKYSNWVVHCQVDVNTIKDKVARMQAKKYLGKDFFGKTKEDALKECKKMCNRAM